MSAIPTDLDHIVLAGPDLAAVVAGFEQLTGVRGAPGGKHPTGTENHLVAFTVGGRRTRHYLELIGPTAGVEASEVETFGISRRSGPGVATFAIHPADVDAVHAEASSAGVRLGDLRPLSRRKPDGDLLEWRVSGGPGRDPDPAVPFLIDWADTPHPALGDLPTIELVSVTVTHPEPEALRATYAALGLDADIVAGPAPAISFTVVASDGGLATVA